MRAARLERLGDPPRLGSAEEPTRAAGQATLELRAVALNPLDVAIGSGRFYGGSPSLPYTPGCEGVGRVVEADALEHGARVYVWGDGLGVKRDGTLAERVAVSEELAFRVPDGVADEVAVACGIAGAPPVRTDEVREAVGADALEATSERAEEGGSPFVARLDRMTRVSEGERIELAVTTERLHFFDPETGQAIYGEAEQGTPAVVETSGH